MWLSTLLLASVFCHSAQYGLPGSPDFRTPEAAYAPPASPPLYEPPLCPAEGTQTFPDARLCEAYYLCINGERTHLLCPEGEVIKTDGIHFTCVSAANATCILVHPYDVPHEPPVCPNWGKKYFPDVRICDGFYECINGERRHKLCQAGQVFSSADPNTPCTDAANVFCPPLPPPVPWNMPECGDLSWKHLPVPDDCSAFFECRGGIASWRKCPEDLLYNSRSPATRYPCDYPFNAQCGAPQGPPVPPPWGFLGPMPPPRGPSVPVSPPNDRQSGNSTKVFNFYTYVTHNW